MLMFARKVHHLRHLGLCHLISIDAAFAYSMVMYMQHNSCGGFVILAEEPLKDVHDNLHRRVIVVENQDPVHIWPLGLRLGLRNDTGARPTLLIAALAIVVRHPGRAAGWQERAGLSICFSWGRHSQAETVTSWGYTMAAPAYGQHHHRDPDAPIPTRQFVWGCPVP